MATAVCLKIWQKPENGLTGHTLQATLSSDHLQGTLQATLTDGYLPGILKAMVSNDTIRHMERENCNAEPSPFFFVAFPFSLSLFLISTRACVVFQYTCGFASAYTELYGAYDRWLHIVGNFKAGD